ncbi:MAG: hypothetical protein IPF47_01565 [Gemmatimonadetes bacterium]|nr:hypothetical protein [Gemmatimonadota bacterium]
MSTYHLRTIGTPSCVGPRGALTLDDPLLVPLLGILAVAGSDGIEREELVVLLTPNATSSQARNELDRLLALVGAECGDEHLVAQRGTRLMLTPGAVSVDFALLPAEAEHATSAFLRDADIKDAPEFADWLAAARRRVRPKEIDATPPQGRPAMASARTVDTQRTSRWITVALMLLVAVTAAVVMTRPRRTAGFVAGDPVLLADIENTTGDTLLDRGILSAASIALQQSAHLRLYSRAPPRRLRAHADHQSRHRADVRVGPGGGRARSGAIRAGVAAGPDGARIPGDRAPGRCRAREGGGGVE